MTEKSRLPSVEDKHAGVFEPFQSLHREIDRLFDQFGWPIGQRGGNGDFRLNPNVDVSETDTALEITAELPGVSEKDIDVTLRDNVLTIKGEKKAETKKEEKNYHMVERSYGSFQRSLTIPFEANADDVDADFENGVLKVTLPKPPDVKKKTRKIAVKPKS